MIPYISLFRQKIIQNIENTNSLSTENQMEVLFNAVCMILAKRIMYLTVSNAFLMSRNIIDGVFS